MKEHINALFNYKDKVSYVDFILFTALHQKKCKEIAKFVNTYFENYDFELKRNGKYDFALYLRIDDIVVKIELVRMLKRVFTLSLQITQDAHTQYAAIHLGKNDNFEEMLTTLYNECISKTFEIS